jgi:hypothetical protein
MPHPPRLARLLVVALAVAVAPLKAVGCGGRTACFTISAGQACPTQDALNMSIANSPTVICTGAISHVDGPGSPDGDLCCYPVTYSGNNNDFTVPCDLGPGGFTGTAGFSTGSSSSGFGAAGGGSSTSTFCVSCNAALNGAPFSEVCDPSALTTLRQCACASACTSACDPTLCFGNSPDDGCLACMQQSCSADLAACQSN